MPFIKAKNGNVVELAEDLVEEFLAQGHAGPFDTAADAAKGVVRVADESEVPSPDGSEPTEPNRGASKAEWAAWAAHLGIEVPADAGRDAIRDAVEEALAADEGDDEDSDESE